MDRHHDDGTETLMRTLFDDVRYAFRQFRRERVVSCVLVLTIALGIGVNTAIYGMPSGFLRPLPVRSPDEIVVLAAQVKGDETGFQYTFSYPVLQDFRAQAQGLRDIFAFAASMAGLRTDARSTQFVYSAVTGNYFTALGVAPAG